MKVFNEYGVPILPELNNLTGEIGSLVNAFLDELIRKGATPVEIQAVERHVSMAATIPFTEKLLVWQSRAFVKKRVETLQAKLSEYRLEHEALKAQDPIHPRLDTVEKCMAAVGRLIEKCSQE